MYKHSYLQSGVEYHDVVVGEVGLAEVAALFTHAEVALVVAAPEQPGQLREPRLLVVRAFIVGFSPQTNPEEILRLLALVYYLLGESELCCKKNSCLFLIFI